MRVLLFTLLSFMSIVLACQKKSVPVIADREAPLPQKTGWAYPPTANVKPDTARGSKLYTMSCKRCHELPAPEKFTQRVWDGYLSSMFPRTRLNMEEAFHVRAYVMAYAQQAAK